MKIGILKADSVLDQFQPEFGDYPDMFVRILSDAASATGIDISFVTYDVEHGEYPENIDVCDGYVITGSKKSVYDDEAWIHDLQHYVVQLHEAKKKLVGVCFGHQMVAQALGGKTEPAAKGWGVGVHHSDLVASKAYMTPALAEIATIVSHKDQVTVLPPGAERLATSDFCPNSMYQVGEHIFCLQGHPEFVAGYSNALIHFRRELIGEDNFKSGIASLDQPIDGSSIAQWILRFIAA